MEIRPWDRQRDEKGELEPAMWYGRFDLYRSLGTERSLLGAYRAWRVERGAISYKVMAVSQSWVRNSRLWHWKDRAEAWDNEQRRLAWIDEQEQITGMRERHLKISQDLQMTGGLRLARILLAVRGEEDSLSPNDVRLFLKDGIDIERVARGLPKEIARILTMSDDELLEFERELTTNIRGGASGEEETGPSDEGKARDSS